MKKYAAAIVIAVMFFMFNVAVCAESGISPDKLKAEVKESMRKGLDWLMKQQNPDGSFGDKVMNPAYTSLAVASIAKSPMREKYMKTPEFDKAVKFVLGCVKEDGGIYISDWAQNYHTSIGLMALASISDNKKVFPELPDYTRQIEKTQKFIKDLQAGGKFELESADKDYYGGFGYRRGFSGADMSNTAMALMALKESGLTADDEVWKRAITFIEKCQNTKVDGGFIYRPGESKAGEDERGNYRSYQSMTYAGLLSFIYANVDKDDERVQAAVKWICDHWDLSENIPIGRQGLFYNYHTMAKALNAYGEKYITDKNGLKHNWYLELAQKLISEQKEEGYWVNDEERWFETDKILVTCYSILALNEGYENYK